MTFSLFSVPLLGGVRCNGPLENQAKVWIGGFKKPFFNLVLIPELLSHF
jgi:hypothetical protein